MQIGDQLKMIPADEVEKILDEKVEADGDDDFLVSFRIRWSRDPDREVWLTEDELQHCQEKIKIFRNQHSADREDSEVIVLD